MKRKFHITSGIIFLIVVLIAIYFGLVLSDPPDPSLTDYTAYPPFASQIVTPNVLITLDNSGSMFFFAYNFNDSGISTGFNHATNYYGYFNSNQWYTFDRNRFNEAGPKTGPRPANSWDGNFLNWLTMRRVDIARKALVGGKAVSRSGAGNPHDLIGEQADYGGRGYLKSVTTAENYTPYSGTRCFRFNYGTSSMERFKVGTSGGICPSNVSGSDVFDVKVHLSDEPLGVIQRVGDKVRWGLEFFNDEQGGRINTEISNNVVSSMVTAIEDERPGTWTPLGEALWTATGYFKQDPTTGNNGPRYFNPNAQSYRVALAADPFNFGTAGSPNYVWCAKSFILIITDGEPTRDRNIPTPPVAYQTTYTDGTEYVPGWAGPSNPNYFWYAPNYGSHYIDDVALWSRVNLANNRYRDLRSDLEGDQYITTYVVWAAFGGGSPDGRTLLQRAARNGGFEDSNGNYLPDLPIEYDKDGDGNPDTYFEANEGAELESKLIEAIADILRRASSGTAVSVLATAGEGEGAVYQAYFFPEKLEGLEERKWIGYIHSLFLDQYGNLREDTIEDKTMNLTDDFVIKTRYDPIKGTLVDRYNDSNGDGKVTDADKVDTIPLDNIHSIWNGGKRLWDTDHSARKIYTTLDGSSLVTFDDDNDEELRPYLRANDDTEAENIINYIRGQDITGYRKRTITIDGQTKVWKLGDIVYSTPTAVSRPMENYDLIYGDSSYSIFRQKYINRRHVVYVGANDGMLHAFNGGFYDINTHRFSGGGRELGDELWAFIPRELLPHLKWLTDPNYTHVYYVDLKPKVTDVKIFSDDATHPGGWGTILIGGMRYGGKTISTEAGDFSSAFFALDITDPLNPRLLWTFSTTDLGLTMSYPAVAKVGDEWYVIFGSGPTDFDSLSNLTGFQKGKIFVLKISGGSNGVISSWTQDTSYWKILTGHADAFMASPITIDVNTNYNVDVAYIGENYKQGTNRKATMWRLTNIGSAVSLTELYNVDSASDISKRITASPSAAKDKKGNLWIYFGTGQFFGTGDRNQSDTGAFYGIKDGCWNGSCSTTYSNLLDVSDAVVGVGGGTITGVTGASNWTELLNTISTKDGWAIYFNNMPAETTDFLGNTLLHQGERVTTKPAILGGLVMFATYIPGGDICTVEGTSNLYVLYYETGTAYKDYVFKKEKELATPTVSRAALLGKGLPASIGISVTSEGKIKGFVQSSTGDIQQIEELQQGAQRSGYVGWKTGGL
ncbi:MAG: PilC/PilY family type IV pilus protein [Nitrospirota bacterium]